MRWRSSSGNFHQSIKKLPGQRSGVAESNGRKHTLPKDELPGSGDLIVFFYPLTEPVRCGEGIGSSYISGSWEWLKIPNATTLSNDVRNEKEALIIKVG
jgi:hypothetical protein